MKSKLSKASLERCLRRLESKNKKLEVENKKLHRQLNNLLAAELDKRNATNQISLDILREHQRWLHENYRGIFPELSALIYESRNVVRAFIDKRNTSLCCEIRDCAKAVTDRLYAYRIFLPLPLFDQLHKFKHHLQDLVMVLDTQTRRDIPVYVDWERNGLPPEAVKAYEEIEKLFLSITETVQQAALTGQIPQPPANERPRPSSILINASSS